MNILITGGAGFIGSHLAKKLLHDGHQISIIDDFNDFYDPAIKRANIAPIQDQVKLFEIDLCHRPSTEQAVAAASPDMIIHLAARAGVRPSLKNPQLYIDTNINGTLYLLQAARELECERFILASSSSVYGLAKEAPFAETLPLPQTISHYAATKIAAEQLCGNFSHLYGLRTIALRFFTVYGPGQRPDLAIHRFTDAIAHGKPIQQFGDGNSRRDYTYIDDILQGIMGALKYQGPLFDIFNLGENATTTLRELIKRIETSLGRKAIIESLPDQPGDVPLTCADISKAQKLLGYQPKTSLEEGIPKFIEWYLSTQ